MSTKLIIPRRPSESIKEANWRATLANQARRIGEYGKNIVYHDGKFNPIQAIPRAIREGYRSTAVATSPMKQKNLTADALNKMYVSDQNLAKGVVGKDVRDVATGMRSGGGIRQYLRDKGWLSVGRQTKGRYTVDQQKQINQFLRDKGVMQEVSPGQFRVNEKLDQSQLSKALQEARSKFKSDPNAITFGDKAKDMAYNALPGEKAILAGSVGLGAGGELMSKQTETGRQKSLAERIGRAGTIGAVETLAVPLGIGRKFGLLGMAGEQAATIGLPEVGYAIDRRLKPSMPKQASVPKNPRANIRRLLK